MGPLDALGHLLNLLLPALGVAVIAAGLAKLVWWRELRAVPWRRLATHAAVPALAALVAGLVIGGRDGRMSTYLLLVLGCALGLWWAAFGPGRR